MLWSAAGKSKHDGTKCFTVAMDISCSHVGVAGCVGLRVDTAQSSEHNSRLLGDSVHLYCNDAYFLGRDTRVIYIVLESAPFVGAGNAFRKKRLCRALYVSGVKLRVCSGQ